MPNVRDASRRQMSFTLKREQWYLVKQSAAKVGISQNDFILRLVDEELKRRNEVLTPENAEKVKAETAEAKRGRKYTRS